MKYFKDINTDTLRDRHRDELIEMSVEYREYLLQAWEYAIAHGFKVSVFDNKGKCVAKKIENENRIID
jgi:hypothetical protein